MTQAITELAPAYAPTLIGLHHAGLTVRDVEASEAWYGRVLGLTRAFVEPHGTGSGYAVVLTRAGTSLFLGLDHHQDCDRQPFHERRTGLDHLALRVAARTDIDAWRDRLDALGIDHAPISESNEPMPLALMVFRDPDGIQLEVFWSAD